MSESERKCKRERERKSNKCKRNCKRWRMRIVKALECVNKSTREWKHTSIREKKKERETWKRNYEKEKENKRVRVQDC